MALWLIRAGKHGEHEEFVMSQQIAVHGNTILRDLSKISSRSTLRILIDSNYPDVPPKTIESWSIQLWTFLHNIKPGDLVAMPLKLRSGVALGEVKGRYRYWRDFPAGAKHVIPIHWFKEIPRSAFAQDIRYSLGAARTICRIQRNDAEVRVRALIRRKSVRRPA